MGIPTFSNDCFLLRGDSGRFSCSGRKACPSRVSRPCFNNSSTAAVKQLEAEGFKPRNGFIMGSFLTELNPVRPAG